jgi:hypothetical protein
MCVCVCVCARARDSLSSFMCPGKAQAPLYSLQCQSIKWLVCLFCHDVPKASVHALAIANIIKKILMIIVYLPLCRHVILCFACCFGNIEICKRHAINHE